MKTGNRAATGDLKEKRASTAKTMVLARGIVSTTSHMAPIGQKTKSEALQATQVISHSIAVQGRRNGALASKRIVVSCSTTDYNTARRCYCQQPLASAVVRPVEVRHFQSRIAIVDMLQLQCLNLELTADRSIPRHYDRRKAIYCTDRAVRNSGRPGHRDEKSRRRCACGGGFTVSQIAFQGSLVPGSAASLGLGRSGRVPQPKGSVSGTFRTW